jgi:ankyrin repeat protein
MTGNRAANTKLFEAVKFGTLKAAKAALDAGASINARDAKDFTPLHYAAEANRRSVVQLLMQHGADANAEDKHLGRTPIDLAASGPGIHMVRLLDEAQRTQGHARRASDPKATHVEDAAHRKSKRGPRQPGG